MKRKRKTKVKRKKENVIEIFWKEILLTSVLSIALLYLSGLTLSSLIYVYPFFVAILASYLITKKSKKFKHTMLIPALVLALVVIILTIPIILSFIMMGEEEWKTMFEMTKKIAPGGYTYAWIFEQMTLKEFQAMTMVGVFFATSFYAITSFVSGLIGGLVGRFIRLKFGGKRK